MANASEPYANATANAAEPYANAVAETVHADTVVGGSSAAAFARMVSAEPRDA